MFGRKKQEALNEQLDRIGRAVVRASMSDHEELEAAATSPFLYTRIRARIAAEARSQASAREESWLMALLGVSRRAIPAMLALACAALLFLLAGTYTSTPDAQVASLENVVSVNRDPNFANFESIVFNEENAAPSNDAVLTTIMVSEEFDEREGSR